MREFGSFAVFSLVSFFFIPDILAQNDFFRPASASDLGCGAGGFRFMPCALALARPLAFSPPFGFLPFHTCRLARFAIYSARSLSRSFASASRLAIAAPVASNLACAISAWEGFGTGVWGM